MQWHVLQTFQDPHLFIYIWQHSTFPCLVLTIKLWVEWLVKVGFSSKQIYSSYFTKQTTIPIILQIRGHLCSVLVHPDFLWPQLVNVSVGLNIFPQMLLSSCHRIGRWHMGIQIDYFLLNAFLEGNTSMKSKCLLTLSEILVAND